MAMAAALDLPCLCHRVFRFQNLATSLIDHRPLCVRKSVGWAELGDLPGMDNGVFESSEFLKVDAECQMRVEMLRMRFQDFLQRFDAPFEIPLFLEFARSVIHLVGIRIRHEWTQSEG